MFDISVSSFDADSEVTYIFINFIKRISFEWNVRSQSRSELPTSYLLTNFVTFELREIYFPNF